MTFQTAATKPVPHPITSLILDIRLDPPTQGLPFHRPGDVLRGVVALVNENLEGVRDVKAKVHVESISLKLFWESRTHEVSADSQEYHRGGTVEVLLAGQEDHLLMPVTSGGDALETSWPFEITLPEKASSIEVSHNGRPVEGKGKASANASARSLLPSGGPPSSFRGASASVEHLLEAVVVFAHEGDLETVNSEPVDARGHRVARELESVERVTFEVGPDVQAMMHALEGRGDATLWKKEVEVKGGPEGKVIAILDVTIQPPPLPLSTSLPALPLDLTLKYRPAPAHSKASDGLHKVANLFGLGKKQEDASASASSLMKQDAFTIQNLEATLDIETTQEPKIALWSKADINLASAHPSLSSPEGLTTHVELNFAHALPSSYDRSSATGSLSLPNLSRTFTLSLSLHLSPPASPTSYPVLASIELPFARFPPPSAPPAETPYDAPPGFDESQARFQSGDSGAPTPPPPSFDATQPPPGVGGQAAPGGGDDLPPGYA